MKYPAVLSFSEILPQLAQFDAIIDVRSPAEFAEDHLPGAINCPVLDDAQRIQVGTMYKTISAFEAKKLGAAFVAKNIAQHIENQFLSYPQDWKPLVYCWRGGNRSGAMALIFARIGWPVTQLDGGYKTYRNHVNAELAVLPQKFNFNVLCGPTGSGKSRLLQVLASQGAQVLDLEKLAAHRGSVLGDLPAAPQPSQKRFESLLWELLIKFDPSRPIFVEAESKKVGKLRVPDLLMEKMRASPCTAVTLSITDRVALLMQDYPHFVADPGLLNTQLDFLTHLHGKEKIAHWHQLALTGKTSELVDELLRKHYDPGYLQSIRRNFVRLDQARSLSLPDISDETFQQAARQLNEAANSPLLA
ncbi:MAG: tRNA 2-selenouridine(34) synthase MnmH [Herminiimonas sp.]|uniref:tRNA 2-selenouridine(34) synthase MnmH n=1 Tax=Herminiimonas sp. TaxID=1926289 RepID=UPI00271C80CB|nr:tRNA 2-selenouridine(34) synthase MnmH [Herminiimonas sp.]MDO9421078.1 tRNA 2-selenouridine(34) synthase MnmH [Herminiimonas sp.]